MLGLVLFGVALFTVVLLGGSSIVNDICEECNFN